MRIKQISQNLPMTFPQSDRTKLHIKQLDNMEIGEQYHLLESYKMTNLGVIWIDIAKQRSRICYPITVQYIMIVYSIVGTEIAKKGLIFSGTRIFTPTIRANLHRHYLCLHAL